MLPPHDIAVILHNPKDLYGCRSSLNQPIDCFDSQLRIIVLTRLFSIGIMEPFDEDTKSEL